MPSGPASTAAATNPVPVSPKHGLRDAQLSDLMRRVSANSQRYWPEEVPRPGDDQRIGDAERATRATLLLADELLNAAERIPETVAHIPMSEADRAGIRAEAITLRTQSLRLGQAARAKNMEEVQSGLNAISSTCLSCHSRYRDFAGELEFQRVSRDLPEPTAMVRSDGATFPSRGASAPSSLDSHCPLVLSMAGGTACDKD
jgi:hypothetical protein